MIGVRYGDDGLDLDALEQVLARHEVKVVALQTQCQNPTGRDMSAASRERLARLAVERNFFIVEDGVYVDLRYDGETQPSLRKYAPAHTVFISSLSKSVGGGLRIGWIAGRGPVMSRLTRLKMDNDLHTPTLTQFIAAEFLGPAGTSASSRCRSPTTAIAATRCSTRSSATSPASTPPRSRAAVTTSG